MQGYGKAVPVSGNVHPLQAERLALGIAMVAAGADFIATRDWVPGCVCPFNAGSGYVGLLGKCFSWRRPPVVVYYLGQPIP